jgi:SAM-dependent methyltransferase
MSGLDFSQNIERFTGFAELYDTYRPSPPDVLAEIVLRYLNRGTLEQVVDLGCGSGLSTRYWVSHAREVIGLDPTAAMLDVAREIGGAGIRYEIGISHATGLPDHQADVVACSQSFHWMDPLPTLQEAARILRPGGIFVAFDYDWPPATGSAVLDALYEQCVENARELEDDLHLSPGIQRWEKAHHLSRLKQSGEFHHVREIAIHHQDEGSADRLIGLLLSQGHLQTLLKNGITEEQIGIRELRSAASQILGSAHCPWLWTSRVRLGFT